jgi:iron complex transport system ATP-binding protein
VTALALQARNLRVTLGQRPVLHAVDVHIPQGRWTAIVGPNGAGKTTLLKALAQLLPYAGEAEILGRRACDWSARARGRALAWLGQNETGAQELRAHDVVLLGRLPHQGWLAGPDAQDRAAVQAAMEETQCWCWRDRPLGELSGGERQRVLLARAMAVQAPLMLMDEPLANLDPPHQADWLELVRRQVARGTTVVSVLHEITMALHADDLLVLESGRVVHHGGCSEAATHRALERVFNGRLRVHDLGGRWVALPTV